MQLFGTRQLLLLCDSVFHFCLVAASKFMRLPSQCVFCNRHCFICFYRFTFNESGPCCQVFSLNDLLKTLENHGEVNLQLAEHKLSKDASGNFSVEPLGGVCYVLDAIKQRRKKAKDRARKLNVT